MENNFEKKVQKNLKELRLEPSPGVWTEVEKRIRKKKRKVPMIWWFLFPAITAFVGYYYFSGFDKHKSAGTGTHQIVQSPSSKKDAESAKRKNTAPLVSENALSKTRQPKNNDDENQRKDIRYKEAINRQKTNSYRLPELPEVNPTYSTDGLSNDYVSKPAPSVHDPLHPILTGSKKLSRKDKPVLTVPISQQPKDNKKWLWGFSIHTGISFLTQSPGKNTSGRDANQTSYSPSFISGTAVQSRNIVTNYISSPNYSESTGFGGGINLQRRVGKSARLSLGLDYQYLTIKQTANLLSSAFLFDNNESPRFQYSNTFHFIQLPAAFHSKLRVNNILLDWQAGVQIAGIIGSNSLQYNNFLYYKENSMLNKLQAGVHGALAIKVTELKRYEFKAGPYYQHNFQQMGKQGVFHARYLNFAGIKLEISPKKKKEK